MATKKKRVSIRDVAKEAGVSRSTVSLVLNNSPVPTAETRRQVLEVVERMNYQPDPLFGQAMRRRHKGDQAAAQSTQTIGFYINDFLLNQARIDDGYYSRVLAGVQHAVDQHDYHLMIKSANASDAAPPAIVTENRVDGLVIEGFFPEMLFKLLVDRLPIAVVDRNYSELNVDSVMPNIEKAVIEQLEYLWDLGHRNIIKFTSLTESLHEAMYDRAFFRFFEQRGHAIVHRDMCQRQDIKTERHHEVMTDFAKRIVNANPRPTALVAWDTYACTLLSLLQEHGIRVPEDMSIIGMDDILAAQTVTPQLSSYRFPMEDMGRSATELVFERIKDRSRPVHQIIVSGSLIERATGAAVPGS